MNWCVWLGLRKWCSVLMILVFLLCCWYVGLCDGDVGCNFVCYGGVFLVVCVVVVGFVGFVFFC